VSILVAGGIMTLLALSVDLTAVVAVSTFAQLFYYGAANVSALRLKTSARLYPRSLPAIGLGTCVLLMILVSPSAFAVGLACLITGAAYYVIKQKSSNPMTPGTL
jgi:APA family basic amino acid/polyamine antiporter